MLTLVVATAVARAEPAVVLGVRNRRNGLSTWWVTAEGLEMLGPRLVVPRPDGWWRVDVVQFDQGALHHEDLRVTSPTGVVTEPNFPGVAEHGRPPRVRRVAQVTDDGLVLEVLQLPSSTFEQVGFGERTGPAREAPTPITAVALGEKSTLQIDAEGLHLRGKVVADAVVAGPVVMFAWTVPDGDRVHRTAALQRLER